MICRAASVLSQEHLIITENDRAGEPAKDPCHSRQNVDPKQLKFFFGSDT